MAEPMQWNMLIPIDRFLPEAKRGNPKQYYAYQAIFPATVLLAGATATVAVTIDNDADFLVGGINRVATDATQLVALAFLPATIQLQYTGAGNAFFSQPEHIENVAGSAQRPGALFMPYYLPGGATLNVTLQNLDPANARFVRLSLYGVKVY